MPRRQPDSASAQTEEAISRAGSIGALERLAGVPATAEAREEFWRPFAGLPDADGFDAGVAELKARIRAAAPAKAVPRRGADHVVSNARHPGPRGFTTTGRACRRSR